MPGRAKVSKAKKATTHKPNGRYQQTVYLTEKLAKKLRVHCALTHESLSDVAQAALEEYLRLHPAEEAAAEE